MVRITHYRCSSKLEGGGSMKIKVMVDKDNTHFSYNFDCDKVIDGTSHNVSSAGGCKLVILRKTGKKEDLVNGFEKKVGEQDEMETIAVFNNWTYWRIIDNKDTKKIDTELTYGDLDTMTLINKEGTIVAKLYILPNGNLAEDSWLRSAHGTPKKVKRVCLHCARKFETDNDKDRFCSACSHK